MRAAGANYGSGHPWIAALEDLAPVLRAERQILLQERECLSAFHETSANVGMITVDDLYSHQVHNDAAGLRAVLFVGFERPCRAPVRWLNRPVLNIASLTDEIRRDKANHDAWEARNYKHK